MDYTILDKKVEDLTEADWKMLKAYVHNLQHIVKVQIDLIEQLTRIDQDDA